MLDENTLDKISYSQLTNLANSGDPVAQCDLAKFWLHDCERSEDEKYDNAIEWFGKAAKQGHVEAEYSLGVLFSQGCNGYLVEADGFFYGHDDDDEWDYEYEYVDEDGGYGKKFKRIGVRSCNSDMAFYWLSSAAKHGHQGAWDLISEFAVKGEISEFKRGEMYISSCYKDFVDWCMISAKQRVAEAQCFLGDIYFFSQVKRSFLDEYEYEYGKEDDYYDNIIKSNIEISIDWYRKSAEMGLLKAQARLVDLYEDGYLQHWDKLEVVRLCEAAADQGYAVAQFRLAAMYAEGKLVYPDDKRAIRLFSAAAEQGYAAAQFALGLRYQNGDGVEEDAKEAARWYERASKQGHGGAYRAVTELKRRLWR